MTGPPPKDPSQRRRRNATPGFKLLPHEGRQGPPPPWPLSRPGPDATLEDSVRHAQELTVWEEVWKLPQAVEWERMRMERVVARYVRTLTEAELMSAPAVVLTEARQLEDRLGVTPKAMQSLHWQTDEPRDEEEDEEPAPAPKRRVLAVDPKAANE